MGHHPLALEAPAEAAAPAGALRFFPCELTLGGQRRHVLMAPAVNLMAVGVHGEDQHHDAPHDASGHGAHGGTFNHVQCDHLITFMKTNRCPLSGIERGGVW